MALFKLPCFTRGTRFSLLRMKGCTLFPQAVGIPAPSPLRGVGWGEGNELKDKERALIASEPARRYEAIRGEGGNPETPIQLFYVSTPRLWIASSLMLLAMTTVRPLLPPPFAGEGRGGGKHHYPCRETKGPSERRRVLLPARTRQKPHPEPVEGRGFPSNPQRFDKLARRRWRIGYSPNPAFIGFPDT